MVGWLIGSDGARMASDVKNTLTTLLTTSGGMTSSEASSYIINMIAAKRYVQDIWS
jgi:sulfite reductase alpha subunit-like flavoprotein